MPLYWLWDQKACCQCRDNREYFLMPEPEALWVPTEAVWGTKPQKKHTVFPPLCFYIPLLLPSPRIQSPELSWIIHKITSKVLRKAEICRLSQTCNTIADAPERAERLPTNEKRKNRNRISPFCNQYTGGLSRQELSMAAKCRKHIIAGWKKNLEETTLI